MIRKIQPRHIWYICGFFFLSLEPVCVSLNPNQTNQSSFLSLFPHFLYICNIFSQFFFSFFFFVVRWRCYCWASNFVCIHKFGMKSCVTLAAASMRRHFHQDLHYFAYIDAILLIHSQPAIQFDYHLCDAVWCGLVAI